MTLPLRRTAGAAFLLCVLFAAPALTGCSTLGIAQTKDLDALEAKTNNENQQSATRLDSTLRNQQELQTQVNQVLQNQSATQAQIDSLIQKFEAAHDWLASLNIASLSQDMQTISTTASSANDRSQAVLERYVEWIRSQHETLGQQLQELEAMLQADPGAPSGGSSGSSGNSGGGSSDSGDGSEP